MEHNKKICNATKVNSINENSNLTGEQENSWTDINISNAKIREAPNGEDKDILNTNQPKKKSRKRVCCQDEWKKKKAAIAREKGLPYINQKGKEIQGKTVIDGFLCTQKCPKKCSKKVSLENRRKIFSTYYKLDVNCKNIFLFKCMSMQSPSRPQKNARKHKSCTFHYTINIEKNTVSFCKRAFCSIFQIGKKR